MSWILKIKLSCHERQWYKSTDFSLYAQDVYSDAFTVPAGVTDNRFFWVTFSIRYAQTSVFVDSPFLQEGQNKDKPYCGGKKWLLKSNHYLKSGHSLHFSAKKKKKRLLWFLWGYELYVIWIYSVVSWIAAPLVFAYVILFHNASHRRKQTCFVHTNSQYCNGKTFPRQTKAGESNFGKTRLWMSDFLFLLFFLLHMVSEKEANGKLEVVSPLLCTSNDSSS